MVRIKPLDEIKAIIRAELTSGDITTSELVNTILKAIRDKVATESTLSSLRPSRSPPTQDLTGYSLAGGAIAEIPKTDLDGWSALVATVRASYDIGATAGVRVRWLYSQDGTNYDSPEDAEAEGNYSDLSFAAGATRQRTVLIPIFAPHIKVQVVNLDSTNAVTINMWSLKMR